MHFLLSGDMGVSFAIVSGACIVYLFSFQRYFFEVNAPVWSFKLTSGPSDRQSTYCLGPRSLKYWTVYFCSPTIPHFCLHSNPSEFVSLGYHARVLIGLILFCVILFLLNRTSNTAETNGTNARLYETTIRDKVQQKLCCIYLL